MMNNVGDSAKYGLLNLVDRTDNADNHGLYHPDGTEGEQINGWGAESLIGKPKKLWSWKSRRK